MGDVKGENMEEGEKLLESKAAKIEERKIEKNESLAASPSSSLLNSLMTVVERKRRQALSSSSPLPEAEPTEELLVEEPKKGPSLGQILGVASLIILVFYIFGISWKLFKIHRGTYVEEEPVFYKYKSISAFSVDNCSQKPVL